MYWQGQMSLGRLLDAQWDVMKGKSLLSMPTSALLFTYMLVCMKTINVNKRLCMHQLRE